MSLSRRIVLAGGAVMALAGEASALGGDMTIGDPASPVQVLEFASLTCPHCAAFHAQHFPRLKAAYIDTGRIGFTMREFPTTPAPVAFAMFQLARCGGASPEVYFDRCAALFQRQRAILDTGTNLGVRDALLALGRGWGLSDAEMLAAMQDEAGASRVRAMMEEGVERFGIQGTPSFVINDQLFEGRETYEGLAEALDAALAG